MRLWGPIIVIALCLAGCEQNNVPTASHSPQDTVAAPPSPDVSPTPFVQLDVPESTPVIVFHDPMTFDQLDGMTWDGAMQGILGGGVGNGGSASPQGTFYATMRDIRDRAGRVVSSYDPRASAIFWADDGTHFCDLARTASRNVSSPGMLQLGAPGQPLTNVAQVGMFAPATSNGGGPVLIACSPSAGRAVVYEAGGQGVGVASFWVIGLSNGQTIWKGGSGAWIAASHDGRYVALSPSPGVPTNIYGQDGKVVATWPQEIFGFSWDGNLAVVAGSFGGKPSIIRWKDRAVIWSAPGDQLKYWQTFGEPGGDHIAVGVLDPAFPQTGGFAPVDLLVVASDGTTVLERKGITLLGQ